jgi:hypothetical protein
MNRIVKIGIILLGVIIAFACNEYLGLTVNCDECYYPEPDSADLTIYLTINENHPEVPIVLYRGDVENGQEDWIDTARETPYRLYSAVNQFYSVTAEYKVDEKTIVVIDGDELKPKHVSDACDYECWVLAGGVLNAELKYE